MSEARAKIGDRMMVEILEYLYGEILPKIEPTDEDWAALTTPDQELTKALAAFERGEISYPQLEAAGVQYVEAWQNQAGTRRPVGT